VACTACGRDLEGAFAFCPFCGAPQRPTQGGEVGERRVVTVVFCDLVGFTSTSERADPEDVDRMLRAYFALARRLIESYGGVVEKFIGDAVVGVFGVPVSHEDDPERAVRAALRIAEDAESVTTPSGEALRLRLGVNTGEVLVRRGVAPGAGEGFLAGDAVNTASRLQSLAPPMGVVVGASTYEATAAVFAYTELPPAEVKGKSGLVHVFQALHPLSRFGTDLTRVHDGPFVGREVDQAILQGMFEKAVAASSAQLVLVVGEPGIGKSRSVAELFRYVDARPGLVSWRQGRCLPYGDGITFWALGEIVKAHAGILESDQPAVAAAKLEAVLPTGADRAWLRQRLLPLVGVEGAPAVGREELFTAWRRFLESLAEENPAVLVVEDLHWADPAMLAFVADLADRAVGVPLLVVGTARPELFDRHPAFATGLTNVNRINLEPLSASESARLVTALADGAHLPADVERALLERAGGNPLFVEEYVRLLRDRDLLHETAAAGDVPALPDSVQALIAARLDTLEPGERALLGDAAVVGKVFWVGALAAMGGRDLPEISHQLHELSRRQLVRLSRRPSIEQETEYAFWHVLTRDVAYAQLPRDARARRHVAVARWMEAATGERVEDVADILAHHYATAVELLTAAGRSEEAEGLRDPAVRFLTLAGHRALGLDISAALVAFERGLALIPEPSDLKAPLLLGFAEAASAAARFPEARRAAAEAAALFAARGDRPSQARALRLEAWPAFRMGDNVTRHELNEQALALLESLPPSQEYVEALAALAGDEALRGHNERALELTTTALRVADENGLDPTGAYARRGLALCNLGDRAGMADLRTAMELAGEHGGGPEGMTAHTNLSSLAGFFDGPQAQLDRAQEALAFARARGNTLVESWMSFDLLDATASLGRLDEVLDAIAVQIEQVPAGDDIRLLMARGSRLRAVLVKGEAERASDSLDWLEATAVRLADPQWRASVLTSVACAHAALGHRAQAASLLDGLAGDAQVKADSSLAIVLPDLVRAALLLGDLGLARRLVADVPPRWPYTDHALCHCRAMILEESGDLEEAAAAYEESVRRWRDFGVVTETAFALLGLGRTLLALGRPDDAGPPLRQARELFADMNAPVRVDEVDCIAAS